MARGGNPGCLKQRAHIGLVACLAAVLFHRSLRGHLVRGSLLTLANLLLMGILLDSICQWLILGSSYPGAALVVGPVLIAVPYSVALSLANPLAKVRR